MPFPPLPQAAPATEARRPRHGVRDVEFIKAVLTELRGARLQFPTNEHQLAALTEEVGELAQALIDCARGTQTPMDVYIEAVQVAAMACRVAVDGDASFGYVPPPLKDNPELGKLPEEPSMCPPPPPKKLSDEALAFIKAHANDLTWIPPAVLEESPTDVTPIKGWLAIINDAHRITETDSGPRDPSFYVCPTIWPDRYAALKVYGAEKIAAFVPLNTHVGENK